MSRKKSKTTLFNCTATEESDNEEDIDDIGAYDKTTQHSKELIFTDTDTGKEISLQEDSNDDNTSGAEEVDTNLQSNEFEIAHILSGQVDETNLMNSNFQVVFSDSNGQEFAPENQTPHYLSNLPFFRNWIKENLQEFYERFEKEVFWTHIHYVDEFKPYFKFAMIDRSTNPRQFSFNQALVFTQDENLLKKVIDMTRKYPNNNIWLTREGHDQYVSGSVGNMTALTQDTLSQLHSLEKGTWPFPIVQFDRKWCSMAGLLSCTNPKFIKRYPQLKKALQDCNNEDGMCNLGFAILRYQDIVREIAWVFQKSLFSNNRLITLRHCFNVIIRKEPQMTLYLITFQCGTGTSHVVAIDTHNKLLLDTDSGNGRREPFKFSNSIDVEHIMYLLFQVDCTKNIVSHVYLRKIRKN